jgi:hypothetical protein
MLHLPANRSPWIPGGPMELIIEEVKRAGNEKEIRLLARSLFTVG